MHSSGRGKLQNLLGASIRAELIKMLLGVGLEAGKDDEISNGNLISQDTRLDVAIFTLWHSICDTEVESTSRYCYFVAQNLKVKLVDCLR